MKKQRILLCLLALISLGACQPEETASTKNVLPIESFEIKVGSDTTITTNRGIILHFSPQTLMTKEEKVTIEIKAALSRFEMVSEGLSSLTAEGELLESMGMLHLDSPSEVQINAASPIKVKLPSDKITTAAKVFTGSNVGKTVKWEESTALDSSGVMRRIAQGALLFSQYCTNCHNPNLRDQLTGPALGRITSFRDSSFLMAFTRNSQQLIAAGDTLALCLFQAWNNSVMTSFDSLSDPQIWSIYEYIESESIARGISTSEMTYLDTCDLSSNTSGHRHSQGHTVYNYNESGVIIDSVIISDNDTAYQYTPPIAPPLPPNPDRTTLSQQLEYYEFDVKEFGWYNIDLYTNAEVEEIENFKFKLELDAPERFNGFAIFRHRAVIIPLQYYEGFYYLLNGWDKEKVKFSAAISMRIILIENTEAEELEVAYLDIVSQLEDNDYELELEKMKKEEVVWLVNEEW